MIFVIWGRRTLVLTVGSGLFFCPKCQSMQSFLHKRAKRFFTLYYLPVFPIGDGPDFVHCQNCQSDFKPIVLQMNPLSSNTYKVHHPILRVVLVIAALIFALVAVSSIQSGIQTAQEQRQAAEIASTKTALNARYGDANLKKCQSLIRVPQRSLPGSGRMVVVDSASLDVSDALQNQLPQDMRATGSQDLTDIICLKTSTLEYGHADYGDSNRKVTVYTCLRYQQFVEAYVLDAQSGETVAYRAIPGAIPPECPDSTDSSVTLFGDRLTPEAIIAELTGPAPTPEAPLPSV